LLDNFTDLFWDALFSRLPGTRAAAASRVAQVRPR
jgi:hypothetical protein